ncbi:MAG: glycerophosphodiester phosphodiesterase [Betaproteobacteria bacterium]|nr:glycerophosphodiester phosphodiesterase [Betaproteobacteria bacterium]
MSWPRWNYSRYIAHRCGGALAPENTLAGLHLAARLGFRAVEFDVMLSADGAPLLIHDETLERTTDGGGRVAETPLLRLCQLDAGRQHHRAYAGERLPTLQQTLDACRALGLAANIEIKPATGFEAETGTAVGRLIERSAQDWQGVPLLFSSFSETALAAARAAAPALPRALLVEAIPADWRERLQQLECLALHCAARHLQAEQVAEIAAAGYPLACYTVNRPEDAERLFAYGVAAVFTDRLDLFDPLRE